VELGTGMFPKCAHVTAKNNVSDEQVTLVQPAIERLDREIDLISTRLGARRATVRARLVGSLLIDIDDLSIHLCGQPHFGMPTVIWHQSHGRKNSLQKILDAAKYDIGFSDPYGVTVPYNAASALDSPDTGLILKAIALEYVQSEIRRFEMTRNIIQINPIFGTASFAVNEKLVFALMPFNQEMNAIYTSKIKPCIESGLNMIVRRADEFKNANVIMQDIWKSICEARIVLADLTGFNPNVMYELGIAHTVGKETLILYQNKNQEGTRFPFDLAHIRRIEYENTMEGGQKLEATLKETVINILSPAVVT
jgi:nucleoside 2-deoxyribosyltransferase